MGRNRDGSLSHVAHRRLIGWLGLVLLVVLVILAGVWHTADLARWEPLDSISAYYYTGATTAFVGTLFALALFLFTYGWYQLKLPRFRGHRPPRWGEEVSRCHVHTDRIQQSALDRWSSWFVPAVRPSRSARSSSRRAR